MIKRLFLLFFASMLAVGCSKFNVSSADDSDDYFITIESEDGITQLQVSSDTEVIKKAAFVSAEDNSLTTREYKYDAGSNLKSIYVNNSIDGSYMINYEGTIENPGKSVMEGNDNIPVKSQKISRNFLTATKSITSTTEPDIVEYYYDEEGNLSAILRVDENNNLIIKGAE